MILFVIDKSEPVTERLVALAKKVKGITAIYTAGSFNESIDLLKREQPDLVLMDMNLPAPESVELLKIMKKTNNATSYIVLFKQVNEIKKQYCEFLGMSFIFDKHDDLKKIAPALDFLTSKNVGTRVVNVK